MIVAILATFGAGERGAHLVIRSTAQTSFVLFTTAFVASPLLKLWPGKATAWLRANRRYIGVSFAVSHLCHGLAILGLAILTSGASLEEAGTTAVVGGSIIYAVILAMAATSFDRTARWIGPRAWHRLHTTGIYLLWLIFALAYVSRALNSILDLPFALIVIGAMALRVTAKARKLQHKAASA
jgi:DMSO/TMAO reductase YedYZ heme-binding membrane subunit